MRSKRQLVKTLPWAALLFTCVAAACDSARKEDAPHAEAVAIPLESIYSTNGQEGLIPIVQRLEEPYGVWLDLLYRKMRTGASNVFLVRGKDVTAAIKATHLVFAGGRSANVDVDPEDGSKSEQMWLVAYFGTAGSGPPAWLVSSAERRDTGIRLSFSEPRRDVTTRDICPYFAWVPLGNLKANEYTLELLDSDKQEVVLRRRVTVRGE